MFEMIRKDDGNLERFHRHDIVESLVSIGLEHKEAKEIAKKIKKHNGMTEHEIKVKIFDLLEEIDPNLADMYFRTKKVLVKHDLSRIPGYVLMPQYLMDYLDLQRGSKVDVIHTKTNGYLRAIDFHLVDEDHDTVFMSEQDMSKLDIKDGEMVAICKHNES
jgi:hypothetical protein